MSNLQRLVLLYSLLAAACDDTSAVAGGGSAAAGAPATGGATNAGGAPQDPAGGGAIGGAGSGEGGDGTAVGGGSGGESACAPTPGTVACGDAVCDLSTEYCCGGPSSGSCFAIGSFCGLGGAIAMHCDDAADCKADEVCCPREVENNGNDAPYEASCAPLIEGLDGGPDGCGKTGGGFDFPALCACDSECYFGNCESSTVVYVVGTNDAFMSCQI